MEGREGVDYRWAEITVDGDGQPESLTIIEAQGWTTFGEPQDLRITLAMPWYTIEWEDPAYRRVCFVNGWDILQDGNLISSEDWKAGLEASIAAAARVRELARG